MTNTVRQNLGNKYCPQTFSYLANLRFGYLFSRRRQFGRRLKKSIEGPAGLERGESGDQTRV